MILDQRLLPGKTLYMACRDMRQVIYCIKTLAVRGAPAIGVAAAMGISLAAEGLSAKTPAAFRRQLKAKIETMRKARPTAVNLGWACDRILALVALAPGDIETMRRMIRRTSQLMLDEDIAVNQAIGQNGAKLIRKKKATVLTHCNAGSLATGGYGTALAPVWAAVQAGKQIAVIADETRPLLQGARLTAWECVAMGVPVRVAVDSAVGVIMSRGMVDLVIVGADRIAANGDVANKVGTFNVALQAARHGVPFYVAAPLSTVDLDTISGKDIPIEERDPGEVTAFGTCRVAARGAGALNFAFDVTPADLVSAIITEKGVLRPPYGESLAKAKALAKK
ncbi:MAG: S-methyl-5-thioribose-1-phosphate isomerase [Desulfarculus sp.]|nr:S-methyl-5-thioribose-1-phosphate isomerase [Desulfarculus sp.]